MFESLYTTKPAKLASVLADWFHVAMVTPKLLKYFGPWLRLVGLPSIKLLDLDNPWVTFEAAEWVENAISADMTVFEWGSGASTMYFSSRVAKVYSVEHDAKWHATVQQKLRDQKRVNVHSVLRPPTIASQPSAASEFASASAEYKGYWFADYCTEINRYPDRFFDIVLVDGRARPNCVQLAVAKVRPGGYLILDNSDRAEYASAIESLSHSFQRIALRGPGPCNPHFWETTVFRKM